MPTVAQNVDPFTVSLIYTDVTAAPRREIKRSKGKQGLTTARLFFPPFFFLMEFADWRKKKYLQSDVEVTCFLQRRPSAAPVCTQSIT